MAKQNLGPLWHRIIAYSVIASMLLHPASAFAANDFQSFTIPNADPESWDEIKQVVQEGANNDPMRNIPKNLEEAMCGGWDFELRVNGIFDQEEDYTVGDETITTNPNEGFIAKITGLPGRIASGAYANIKSGMAQRKNNGGLQNIEFKDRKRQLSNVRTGFNYPQGTAIDSEEGAAAGFETLCRTPGHPDLRTPAPIQTYPGPRDVPVFMCEHPCQRPLDTPGKPGNWNEKDSTAASCGGQQPYPPASDMVKYACGGGETKGPGDDMITEMQTRGPLGGLCEDLNKWVYILWSKQIGTCIIPGVDTIFPVYQYEKGHCGFPKEIGTHNFPDNANRLNDNWKAEAMYECCSDVPYTNIDFQKDGETNDEGFYEPTGNEINFEEPEDYVGRSCKVCLGEKCRLNTEQQPVIVNDAWIKVGVLGAFPNDVCVNFRADERYRYNEEPQEYISYFREYPTASYERAEMEDYIKNDDHKKEDIPVACYGMYDLAPEDALPEQTEAKDKRCTIAAYYDEDDGDGDGVNFWRMKDTQKGIANYDPDVPDDPFNDPARTFNPQRSLWYTQLSNAFSMLNQTVFEKRYHNDFSFALLATDEARQRATVQLDRARHLSDGSLLRTFDDTVTIDEDFTPERRTMVEWWHQVETQMHKNFTPPTVRMLLPTTWSVDINPLDPIYTPPPPEREEDRSPDIRSETIEVQVQAKEDLLGDIVAFMERNLLLRIESEPVPVVVPMANPTELRGWAQGWEAWALIQEERGLPDPAKARKVAAQLLHYADQADNARKLRGELPKYATKLLFEQRKITSKIAQWATDNITAYQNYLLLDFGIELLQEGWKLSQDTYRSAEDNEAFPWCRNERFTTPIYSLLDPWMPGRENKGDVTGGYAGANPAIYNTYLECLDFVEERRNELPDAWPTDAVCDPFFPMAPAFPELPDIHRDADIVIDFTAFKEAQRKVVLPVLKPIQIRMDFNRVRPPGLEDRKEPNYPEFVDLGTPADLPELPDSISEDVLGALPNAILPEGDDFDLFQEAAVFAFTEDNPDDQFPKIELPKLDIFSLAIFLIQTYFLIDDMAEEYELFWGSIVQPRCQGNETEDCVRPGTEQDCVKPHDDPKKRCVHFEGDLIERLQRVASRPDVLLFEDYLSIGEHRKPLIMGQEYCEREDWACQVLNKYERKPRDGWQLFITEEYNPDELLQKVRKDIRDATDNIIEDPKDRFLFDVPQEQMFENFRIPEGEHIETYRERFVPPPDEE